jgi:hypothetical protein
VPREGPPGHALRLQPVSPPPTSRSLSVSPPRQRFIPTHVCMRLGFHRMLLRSCRSREFSSFE